MIPAIEVDSLYFSYYDSAILKNISFTVNKGDFVSIIGPNGSGKSTLLKNISSILSPDKGIIKIDGKDIKSYKVKDLAKKIALVPQDTNVPFNFSVFDIVLMGRSPYIGRFQKEKTKDFSIATKALELTDTLHLQDRYINEISGGEKQRVIIARALAQEPEIILLDEPTSHLDINHQIEVLSLLEMLNKEKKMTIVIVIHDINLAARFSSKMILLNNGEILSIGKPSDVISVDNMEKAYRMDMIISHNPYTNSPYIVPLSSKNRKINISTEKKIHVICGGGTGAELINKLYLKRYSITIGVINIGDSDWELSRKLSANIIEEMPFTDISETNFQKNIQAISECDSIVLTSVPYGRGNIKNLEAAMEGLKMGKKVYLIDNYNKYGKYDYVNGKAKKVMKEMSKKGLKVVDSVDKLLEIL